MVIHQDLAAIASFVFTMWRW